MPVQAIPRLSSSLALAVLITGGLLYVMQAMIATGQVPLAASAHRLLPVLVPQLEDSPPSTRDKVDPPSPPVEPPIIPELTKQTTTGGHVQVTPPTGPTFDERLLFDARADGVPIALVKVAASYPPRAVGRGLEGYVIVEYTVTELGTVADVRVVESSDAIFEASAISAATQFRYKPRVVAGRAVATPGVLNKFTFTLED